MMESTGGYGGASIATAGAGSYKRQRPPARAGASGTEPIDDLLPRSPTRPQARVASMSTRMPFGHYKGRPLADLPDTYVEWLASLPNLREPLRSRVRREYDRRFGRHEATPACVALPREVRIVAEKLVARGFGALATAVHPDHGGEHGDMVTLNAAAEARRAFLRGAA